MASQDPRNHRPSLYPTVDQSNPNPTPTVMPSASSLYPSIPVEDLVVNLFPSDTRNQTTTASNFTAPSAPPQFASHEETLISVPGAIVHLIDNLYSVELACGVFSIVRLWQSDDIVAVFARVADDVQWPLMKHEAAVKVDDSHYFFSLPPPSDTGSGSDSDDEEKKGKAKRKGKGKESSDSDYDPLNYGVSFASKGQEKLLEELDRVLEVYCAFSVHKVSVSKGEVLDGSLARETSPEELQAEGKRNQMAERCGAYWTTLAPNVEDYSGKAAKLIAGGSGQLIKGILWCGDVTVDRLKWGNEALKKRMSSSEKAAEINPKTMKRIRRAKRVTKMTQKVATGVLSGVLKVSGYFMTSFANSKAGKKFFNMLPGEILLASLDGFSKICDAAEVAGKNVLSTSSNVTTDLVTHKYGEEAGQATDEGLDAAGHAFGTAWAVFKIRKALNPKNAVKASSLAKSAAKAAAAEYKTKKASK